ncbi:MAG: 50S ribosomal protein L3 [Candidatus Fraserbacteria bacterium RBG_16_55_9]|uniref:Large ribosomal subunit protein uL3 n=1 Tax=Fraserbacteria sp. (strain RBG_16_55_9) TaxID=1817864 RepID=A0A1F5UP87_FRAXR|nr:ribosomal protein L3 [uncultured bacterium]OGF52992.1 MAG: 50S ribosomal protein L3 [Candidatus Fraserbacteria bacterium RBG_16_55_9]
MALGMLGRKLGMMQWFDAQGNALAATVIEAEPNVVVQIKTEESDGYRGLQMGFIRLKEARVNRSIQGRFEKIKVEPRRHLREFRMDDVSTYQVGQEITVGIFQEGERICVSGISKGKGFAGVMKRHDFRGGDASHGSDSHRRPGSIGNIRATGKVFRGHPMAGHMGAERVTVKGLMVLKADLARNLVVLKGAVPGPRGCLVELRKDA